MHIQFVCSLGATSAPPSPKAAEMPLCTVTSDVAGHFIFYPLPPGTYFMVSEERAVPVVPNCYYTYLQVPVYKLEELHFEVHPMEVQFTVSNDSIILPVRLTFVRTYILLVCLYVHTLRIVGVI